MADELRKMVTDAVDANWSMARDAVKNTVSIGIAHAEAALTPAVEPIMEQAQARCLRIDEIAPLPPNVFFYCSPVCVCPIPPVPARRASPRLALTTKRTERLRMSSSGVRRRAAMLSLVRQVPFLSS